MKYLLLDASRANNEQKTGVEWYAYFVIEELKKIVPTDWRVILYTREKLKGELKKLPPNWQEKILNWPPKRFWTQLRLSCEIWQFKKNHPQDDLVLFVPAHVLPLICPTKTIITIHDLGGVRFPGGYSFFERFYTFFSTWWALKKGVVLVPSKFVKQELQHIFNHQKSDIVVVPNAFDAVSFAPKNEVEIKTAAKHYGLRTPYFFSISRLETKKNTIGIVKAFNFLRKKIPTPFQLVLLGKPGWGFESVQKAIVASPFFKDIMMPGWVEQKDVPPLMAGAVALLLPSFYEGFGIPIVEAMALGVPVITSNLASMPEVAGGAALLVNPNKIEEIALGMQLVLEKKSLADDLKIKGLARAKEFSWSKTAQAIFKTVSEVADKPKK